MGLDIGYHLYEKKPVDTENKYIEAGIETGWVCGRCSATYAWGEMFKFEKEKETCPVFQEGLKDKKESLEEYSVEFKYVKFKDFKDNIINTLNQIYEKGREEMRNLLKENSRDKERIKELRELQKSCTKHQEFAFNKWSEEINELQDAINNRSEYYDTYKEEDYDYSHADYVKDLLEEMEKHIKEDKYYVVPYFSY